MAKLYYDKDADLAPLQDRTIGIVGYGIQGHAQARNLRDSGLNVIVSELPDSPPWKAAKKDGFDVKPTAELAAEADVVALLTQDHVAAIVYRSEVAAQLGDGNALAFSHGFNIHFNQIVPPGNVDVFMVAPKGPGSLVRELYERGGGVPALFAVHQDHTGKARDLALAYARGLGATRAGVLETTFAEETETDLFGEQAVLCGGVSELIKASFDTLVEAGYQPELAYFECCHELYLIVKMIYQNGIQGMRKRVSDTAEYGDMTRGPRVIDERVRAEMRKMLAEVQNGTFAREWITENQAGRPVYTRLERLGEKHLIEKVGAELRGMMPFIQEA
jgi:ketol-acid reductoisomerase